MSKLKIALGVIIILLPVAFFCGYKFCAIDGGDKLEYLINSNLVRYGVVQKFFFVLGTVCLLLIISDIFRYFRFRKSELFEVVHAPQVVSNRAGDFTANINGIIGPRTKKIMYRLNNGSWHEFKHLHPYTCSPYFDIELSVDKLLAENSFELKAIPRTGDSKSEIILFDYQKKLDFPLIADWNNRQLEAIHGCWESVQVDGDRRVRPIPGSEGYDRIVVVAGAFEEARRIETYVVFRNHTCPRNQTSYGFGILPLWGGRPDDDHQYPKRGWNFSLAWYSSIRRSVGNEFSYKYGTDKQDWIGLYRPFILRAGVKNNIITETWPVNSSEGKFLYYKQRMKWWEEGKPEPGNWMELEDIQVKPMPYRQYGVAFVCYYCQVELGEVKISVLSQS